MEITTYHAFAWNLIERFGSAVGLLEPVMATEAELRLFQPSGAIRYRDMIPLALRLCSVPAIAAHLRSRWSVIVCDEFQDTDDGQFHLLTAIRGDARLLLLGDPNQCIYAACPVRSGSGRSGSPPPSRCPVPARSSSRRHPTVTRPVSCPPPQPRSGSATSGMTP